MRFRAREAHGIESLPPGLRTNAFAQRLGRPVSEPSGTICL
jgi:hypothetical protein